MSLDSHWVRSHFPSVHSNETVFFDNPGGTQVTQSVIDAVSNYYLTANANHGGAFPTSERSDEIVHQARLAFADFLNASRPEEIAFGPNMTTLTFLRRGRRNHRHASRPRCKRRAVGRAGRARRPNQARRH